MAKFADEQVRAIVAGRRAFRLYPLPGADLNGPQVAVRVLTEAELDETRLAAQSEAREFAKTRGWKAGDMLDVDPEILTRAIERHIVFRSFFDADTIDHADPARFFDSPADLRKLDSVTLTRFAKVYIEHQQWVSPALHMNDEEVEELIGALKKAHSKPVFLGAFAPSTLVRFAISLVSALPTTT